MRKTSLLGGGRDGNLQRNPPRRKNRLWTDYTRQLDYHPSEIQTVSKWRGKSHRSESRHRKRRSVFNGQSQPNQADAAAEAARNVGGVTKVVKVFSYAQ